MMATEKSQDTHSGKRAKYDLPTKDEQKNLLQVESLMRSNLLSLQINEILLQVNAEKQFKRPELVDWVDNLVSDICNSSLGSKKTEVSGHWLLKQGIEGIDLINDSDVKIDFSKPTSVDYIGSFSCQTATAPILNIDLAMILPSDLFDKRYMLTDYTYSCSSTFNLQLPFIHNRDILNHAYFDKRKLYLAAIAKALMRKSKSKNQNSDGSSCYKVSIAWFKGDSRKPILQVSPNSINKKMPQITVRIYPVVSKYVEIHSDH